MKNIRLFFLSTFIFLLGSTSVNSENNPLTENFIIGNPDIKSMNAIAFGPEGILFIGDSRSATVVAFDTKDNTPGTSEGAINMKQLDEQIAALTGTTADAVTIQDMAVNPVSKMIYLAAHLRDGAPVLLKTAGEKLEYVSMKKVSFSKVNLIKAVAEDAKDRRGRSLRKWAISDLAYYNGQVMLTGLSNEEFSSTFRSIPFPFKEEQVHSSLEIYHAAHGRYETYSPIKTFMPYELNGKPHLIASYTCTPLVVFPMDELKPGQHTKGKTVAELGNRNTPLDIISYEKKGKSYLLLANSNRALMKIDPANIESFEDYLTNPVEGNSATAGIDFLALPYVNVLQMDRFNDKYVLLLQRKSNGDLDLQSVEKRRL